MCWPADIRCMLRVMTDTAWPGVAAAVWQGSVRVVLWPNLVSCCSQLLSLLAQTHSLAGAALGVGLRVAEQHNAVVLHLKAATKEADRAGNHMNMP
jgi:hypothetical protein